MLVNGNEFKQHRHSTGCDGSVICYFEKKTIKIEPITAQSIIHLHATRRPPFQHPFNKLTQRKVEKRKFAKILSLHPALLFNQARTTTSAKHTAWLA